MAAGFVAAAAVDGAAPAVIDHQGEYTFDEILHRAGGIAARLADGGDESPVVVLSSYTRDSVAALFGAILAGRGVVPLDPDQPRVRLEGLIARVGDCAVVDGTGTVRGEVAGRRVLDAQAVTPQRFEPVPARLSNVSTIFFTSGSTGVPKGVGQRVAKMEITLPRWQRAQQVGHEHRVAVFMPPNFGGGFAGAVFGLSFGRSAVVLDARRHDPRWIVDFLDAKGVNRATLTPSLARAFADSLGAARLEHVRHVNLTGEALEWADVAAVRRVLPAGSQVRLVYGASETLGAIAVNTIGPEERIGEGRVPLGPPEPDLDFRLEHVDPATGRGELVIRHHVVDGYWDDPVLDAERFGVDPDGVLFWRSGDLVRLDEQGIMHHCGRADDMIKVNGRLVEPAEVERALASVPGVRRSVVLPRALASGRTQVVGHLEVDDTATPDGVRAALRELLPEYLVPAVLVRHDRLPLTDRGKVDRQLLRTGAITPWGSAASTPIDDAFVAAVAAVVKNVLGLHELDPDDVLWDMGCDSLSAIEIVAALLDVHPGRLEPNDLLTAATARELAARLGGATERRTTHVVEMNAGAATRPLFFVGGGGSPALSYRAMVGALGPGQRVVIFEQIGLHDHARPVGHVGETARRNLEHVRSIQPSGPYVVAGHSWGGLVADAMAAELAASGAEVRLVLLDTSRPSAAVSLDSIAYPPRAGWMPDWLWWLEMRAVDVVRSLRAWVPARPGTARYYDRFWLKAVRGARRHVPSPSSVPTVMVQPAGSRAAGTWAGHREITVVELGGDHRTMVHREHVDPAIDHLRT